VATSCENPNHLDRALPPPCRAAGLERLAAFAPEMARYASVRNLDLPPHTGVSRLSPYLRRRLVTEREAIQAAWREHGQEASDKFVSEVLWRSYWKGWLQMRPDLWDRYLGQVRRDRDAMTVDDISNYEDAVAGTTGLACFDHWVGELNTTGYLHNHARMWFASIWIFTLRLPWTLGAEVFLNHLLDGDPASNTLSWRWVAGLHTQGKHYLARAANIARYTRGRFDPRGQLNEHAKPLPADGWAESRVDLTTPKPPSPGVKSVLLVHPDDLQPEHSPLSGLPVSAVIGLADGVLQSGDTRRQLPGQFDRQAMDDTLARCEDRFQAPALLLDDEGWHRCVLDCARRHGALQVVTLFAPVGPWAKATDALGRSLAAAGLPLYRAQRAWDRVLWPGARQGFFRFRTRALADGRLDTLVSGMEQAP
jgi:deoxyribodipyrimidine photo-lyase